MMNFIDIQEETHSFESFDKLAERRVQLTEANEKRLIKIVVS